MKNILVWFKRQVESWEAPSIEWWARRVTALYLAVIFLVAGVRVDEFFSLTLNELGDFLAGAFGPMAFLWLVLGYIQQGKELSASSRALEMQVLELKKTLEFQRITADKQDAALDPVLTLKHIEAYHQETEIRDVFLLLNSGVLCRHLLLVFKPNGGGESSKFMLPILESQKEASIDPLVGVDMPGGMEICVSYTRINGSEGTQRFLFVKLQDGVPLVLQVPSTDKVSY